MFSCGASWLIKLHRCQCAQVQVKWKTRIALLLNRRASGRNRWTARVVFSDSFEIEWQKSMNALPFSESLCALRKKILLLFIVALHSRVKRVRNLLNKTELLGFAGTFNQWIIYSIYWRVNVSCARPQKALIHFPLLSNWLISGCVLLSSKLKRAAFFSVEPILVRPPRGFISNPICYCTCPIAATEHALTRMANLFHHYDPEQVWRSDLCALTLSWTQL